MAKRTTGVGLLALAAGALAAAGCQPPMTGRMAPAALVRPKVDLVEVASSPRQWTGVAVSHAGRIFVNYPRWSDDVPVSVAELVPQGGPGVGRRPRGPVAFPNEAWQGWKAGADPKGTLVCVQSVVVDDQDFLWVVDAGAPNMKEVIPGAPKLLKIDLKANEVVRVYPVEEPNVLTHSYLNDVRVDTRQGFAYITDSGTGAILVLNTATGKVRRLLGDAPSTRSENAVPMIDGRPWRRPDGATPDVHADGIALSPDGQWLYYHALTGRTLYRVPTKVLTDEGQDPNEIPRQIENLGRTGNCDGMEYDAAGRIFLTQIEQNAVARFAPAGSGNRVEILAQSSELAWPDSFAVGPDGGLYVTASRIHQQPEPPGLYRLFKLTPTK